MHVDGLPRGVPMDHGVGHPAGVPRIADDLLPDLTPEHRFVEHELCQKAAVAERLAHARSRRALGRAAVDRKQSANQPWAGNGKPEGNRGAARLRHEQRPGNTELVERATDPLGLCGEGVVSVFEVGPPAVAERFDDDALVALSSERAGDATIAEGGAEDTGDEDERLSGGDGGGSERFPGRDLYVAVVGAVGRT